MKRNYRAQRAYNRLMIKRKIRAEFKAVTGVFLRFTEADAILKARHPEMLD